MALETALCLLLFLFVCTTSQTKADFIGHQKTSKMSWCRGCVDVVVPYANRSAPWYIQNFNMYDKGLIPLSGNKKSAFRHRFVDDNELLFVLRSIELHAKWTRLVHIIVLDHQSQVPFWINTKHPNLRIVPLSVIFPSEHLPTFNPLSVRLHLHRIPEVAPRFVLVESHQIFAKPVDASFFFDVNTQTTRLFMEENLVVDPQKADGFPDNPEWMALRHTANLLLSKFPEHLHRVVYVSHTPYLVHRELLRELVDREFVKQSRAANAVRFAGQGSLEIRLLLPYYQFLRTQTDLPIDWLWNHAWNLDQDTTLSQSELEGLSEFCGLSLDQFSTILLNDDIDLQSVTLSKLQQSNKALEFLKAGWDQLQRTFSNPVATEENFLFIPLKAVPAHVEKAFKELKVKQSQIICIDNNLGSASFGPNSEAEDAMLRNLLILFPTQSAFELQDHNSIVFYSEQNRQSPRLLAIAPMKATAKTAPPKMLVAYQSVPLLRSYFMFKIGFRISLKNMPLPEKEVIQSVATGTPIDVLAEYLPNSINFKAFSVVDLSIPKTPSQLPKAEPKAPATPIPTATPLSGGRGEVKAGTDSTNLKNGFSREASAVLDLLSDSRRPIVTNQLPEPVVYTPNSHSQQISARAVLTNLIAAHEHADKLTVKAKDAKLNLEDFPPHVRDFANVVVRNRFRF